MIIAIKYCGGCNPRYDRTGIARQLGRDFPAHTIQVGAGDIPPGIAVVVCGCSSQCASHENFHGTYGKMVLYAPEQYEALCDMIRANEQQAAHGTAQTTD